MVTFYKFSLSKDSDNDEAIVIILADDGQYDITDPLTYTVYQMPGDILTSYKDASGFPDEMPLGLQEPSTMELEFSLSALESYTATEIVTFYKGGLGTIGITGRYGNSFTETVDGQTVTYFKTHNIIKIKDTGNFEVDMKASLLHCFSKPLIKSKYKPSDNVFKLQGEDAWKVYYDLIPLSFFFVDAVVQALLLEVNTVQTKEAYDAYFDTLPGGDRDTFLIPVAGRVLGHDLQAYQFNTYYAKFQDIFNKLQSTVITGFMFHTAHTFNFNIDPNYLFRLTKEANNTTGLSSPSYIPYSTTENAYYHIFTNIGTGILPSGILNILNPDCLQKRYKTTTDFLVDLFSFSKCTVEKSGGNFHFVPSPIRNKTKSISNQNADFYSGISYELQSNITFSDLEKLELDNSIIIGSANTSVKNIYEYKDINQPIDSIELEAENVTLEGNINNNSLDTDVIFHTYPKEISREHASVWMSIIGDRANLAFESEQGNGVSSFAMFHKYSITESKSGGVIALDIMRRFHIKVEYLIEKNVYILDSNTIAASNIQVILSGTKRMPVQARNYNAVLKNRKALHGVGYILNKAFVTIFAKNNGLLKTEQSRNESDLGMFYSTTLSDILPNSEISNLYLNHLVLTKIENDYKNKSYTSVYFLESKE